ncbi:MULTISPECIES: hypothetical protein [unclassified Streptomyces]|uniref:hypothetical protein n=1 Tax=unclassified Streptomyces TaxID=2593676 RepID=UPI00278C1564|nr:MULTISPECIES: hypothetical protein [unclassified Streptomyces]
MRIPFGVAGAVLCVAACTVPASAAPAAGDDGRAAADRIVIREAGATAWSADTDMRPGDTAVRYLDVRSGHGAPLTVSSAVSATGSLARADGLEAGISSCEVRWSAGGRCVSGAEPLLSGGTALGKERGLPAIALDAGGTRHLKFVFTVPAEPAQNLNGTWARVTYSVHASGAGGDTTGHGDGTTGSDAADTRGHAGSGTADTGGTGSGGGATDADADGPGGGWMASTGTDPWPFVFLAAGLLVAGTGTVAAARRRRGKDVAAVDVRSSELVEPTS